MADPPVLDDVRGKPPQTIVSLPHSRKSHFSVWQLIPAHRKSDPAARRSAQACLGRSIHTSVGRHRATAYPPPHAILPEHPCCPSARIERVQGGPRAYGGLQPLGGRRPAKRINPSVLPVCGPRTHALVDRGMSQYWLVRSPDFCRYGSGKPFAASPDRRNDWSGPA
jgi:hypothetical protein